jgi:hypothetical protein
MPFCQNLKKIIQENFRSLKKVTLPDSKYGDMASNLNGLKKVKKID